MSDFVVGRNYRRREALLGLLLTVPAFIFFAIFSFYPFFRNFYLALYQNGDYPGLPNHYVGFSQFFTTVSSSTFLDSLRDTAIFVCISVPVGVLTGVLLAILAQQKMRGLSIYRTAFASSVIGSAAVGGAVATLFLNPNYGFLPWVHLTLNPTIDSNTTWAMPVVALVQAWLFTGVAFIVTMAGLQSLPEEILEAASIDGASPWRRLWRVTIPMLSPYIYLTVLISILGALQGFGQIDTLVGASSSLVVHTNVLAYAIYQLSPGGPGTTNYGVAACYSIVLFFICLVVTLLQLHRRRKISASGTL